jgi:hypothetical protein
MSKTNFEKLVRWDADYYKELTDDDCIVCLTEREVYIIGQITDMLRWKRTRWIGDILGLDFDLIASNLEYKLSERMTCQNIGTLLQKIEQLESKIEYIFNETVINEGDTIFEPDTTVMDDVFTPQEMQNGDMAVQADVCDNDGKSAIYGATNQLVRYISQVNQDFLEQIEQNFGNLAEQIETVLSAFPPTDIVAADEVAKWTQFIVEELQEEYAATVTETLIQETICDLFCIAVANNCNLTMWDVYNYFGSKVSPTLSNAASTFLDLVQFALIGTFSGNEYYYYMCYFQLASSAFAGLVTGDGLKAYERQLAAGFNSPDADWMIHCIDCPPMYRLYVSDFSFGLNEWVIANDTAAPNPPLGELVSGRLQGTLNAAGTQKVVGILWNDFDPTWRIVGGKFYHEQVNATGSSQNTRIMRYRQTADSNTGASTPISSTGVSNGAFEPCVMELTYNDDNRQLVIQLTVLDDVDSQCYLDKVELLFDMNYAPARAIVTEDADLCT